MPFFLPRIRIFLTGRPSGRWAFAALSHFDSRVLRPHPAQCRIYGAAGQPVMSITSKRSRSQSDACMMTAANRTRLFGTQNFPAGDCISLEAT